jgi:Fe-S-cluster containining protein
MDDNPWIQRFVLEVKKPCPFLAGKDCSIYGRRPITCALFPEAFFLSPGGEGGLNREKFGHYPCLRKPPMISEERRSHLVTLTEMARREAFLTEFYFFGFSPFYVDLRNTAAEVMEVSREIAGNMGDGEKPYEVPHKAFDQTLIRRLGRGGYLSEISTKVEGLNGPRGIKALYSIKQWTDSINTSNKDFPYCYEFDERDRLKLVKRPI